MGKKEFLDRLRNGLSGLPREDTEERLTFYSEMIDDRMEEGLSEEAAVAAVGAADEIAAQIIADSPMAKVQSKRQMKAWEIVLLALGAPIWFSLLIAAFSVLLAVVASLGAVIVSLWAVFGALVACSFGFVIAGIIFALGGNGLPGIAIIGAAFVCTGLAIFLFYGCTGTAKGLWLLIKKTVLWVKSSFARKEAA